MFYILPFFLNCLLIVLYIYTPIVLLKQSYFCRCIISHDIEKECSHKIPGFNKEKLELPKGVVHANLFKEICKTEGKEEEVIKTYLLALELAVEMKN